MELSKIERKLEEMKEKLEESTLAIEMLRELKKSAKRWFIIAIILLIALIGTNIGWLIYESQFETVVEDTTQYIEDLDNPANSNFTQTIN